LREEVVENAVLKIVRELAKESDRNLVGPAEGVEVWAAGPIVHATTGGQKAGLEADI
jgi:hypothetical protein